MGDLIALLSTGKGTWGHIANLIKNSEYDRVFLFTNSFGKEKFTPDQKTEVISFDLDKSITTLQKEFEKIIREKIKGVEVHVNIASGSGNEHMALLAAILKNGLAMRFVIVEDGEFKEIA